MEFLNDVMNIFLPEMTLLLFILIEAIISLFFTTKMFKLAKWISVFGLTSSLLMLLQVQYEPLYYGFKNSVISDTYTIFFKAIILITAILVVLLTKKAVASHKNKSFQIHSIFLTSILSAMILISANDYLTMYVALEALSISTFFLIAMDKGYKSKEATFKYIITNSVATAILLFGISYLYGITGTLNFTEISEYFIQNTTNILYTIASISITIGLLFKLAILPFANWILDVFEGASTVIAAFLSSIPKIAVTGVLIRLLVFNLSYSFELTFILIILTVLTAAWANILALRQRNIKRLLACSSSANASYMIFVASLVSVYNISTVLFYLFAYIFMNIGVFAGIILLENSSFNNKLYEFKNFAYSNPVFSIAFVICVISLVGFPITSGFIAKLYLISAVVRSGLIFLPFLILLVLTMVVAACYYFKIVKMMFERDKTQTNELPALFEKTSSPVVILYICAIITVLLGVIPSKIIELCQIMAYNI